MFISINRVNSLATNNNSENVSMFLPSINFIKNIEEVQTPRNQTTAPDISPGIV